MKLSIALILILGLVTIGSALPAKKRMMYYKQAARYTAPQRMMYVQYVQPAATHARFTQGAEAVVAGESVATGTYLQDCDHLETDAAAAASALGSESKVQEDFASANNAQSVAEAYPADIEPEVEAEAPKVELDVEATAEEEVKSDDDAKVPRDINLDVSAEAAEVETDVQDGRTGITSKVPVNEVPVEEPGKEVETPVVKNAQVPAPALAKRYLPAKKKVTVELEQEEVAHDTADAASAEQDTPNVVQKPVRSSTARRPAVKKSPKPVKAAGATKPAKPLPSGTFFPIEFGGTNGGAIAIANSFSTGEGGSATSHAIAYGSPEASRGHVRPSKYH